MEPARVSRAHQVGPGLVAGPGRHPRAGRAAGHLPGRTADQGCPARKRRTPGLTAITAAAAVLLIGACAGAPAGQAARSTAATRGAAGRSRAAAHAAADLRTRCRSVAYMGDSTSEGMDSPLYLPDPAQRLDAQYRDVGVRNVSASIAGANSVASALSGAATGAPAAESLGAAYADDCWVVALGTNDTADVAAGSGAGRLARIQGLMAAARGRPVLWVNLVSLLSAGPYSEANMRLWNQTLRGACSRYPNMRIFDWASVVKLRWFLNDGIRYTSAGYASRARRIAKALATAFPAGGRSSGCLIS
jgi:hypothetical protein